MDIYAEQEMSHVNSERQDLFNKYNKYILVPLFFLRSLCILHTIARPHVYICDSALSAIEQRDKQHNFSVSYPNKGIGDRLKEVERNLPGTIMNCSITA